MSLAYLLEALGKNKKKAKGKMIVEKNIQSVWLAQG